MRRLIAILVSLALAICLLSCAGPTQQQRGAKTGVLIGAATGAILGQVIGRDTEATLIGAGIGAAVGGLAGHQIGAYMDRQEQELRAAMAASEAASIQRSQDVLTATFKSDVFFDFDSSTLKPGAYAEIGRFSSAVATAREAASLARSQGNAALAHHIDQRRRLYQMRQPLRLTPSKQPD